MTIVSEPRAAPVEKPRNWNDAFRESATGATFTPAMLMSRACWAGKNAHADTPHRAIASRIGARAAAAVEIRIERRVVLVARMMVAAGGIALPQLDERMRDGASAFVEHATGDDDALTDGLAGMLAREIVIGLADGAVAVHGTCQLRYSRR